MLFAVSVGTLGQSKAFRNVFVMLTTARSGTMAITGSVSGFGFVVVVAAAAAALLASEVLLQRHCIPAFVWW